MFWTHQLATGRGTHGLAASFFTLFAIKDYPGTVCALLILVGAAAVSRYLPAGQVLRWAGAHPVVIATMSTGVLAVGTLVVYHNHPLAMDEYAAYFQSRAFAAGHLHGTFPPQLLDWLIPRGFQDFFLNVSPVTGNVAETYWPGFSLLLTPFTWAGVPWLCNPVISALTLIVIHRLALDLFADREAAGMALLLTIGSPVIFGNGISYYSMPAHMLANALFALLLIRPDRLRVLGAGVVGSIALVLHNPVPHILFAAPWLIWIATRPQGPRILIALCAGYLPLCAMLGVGWFLFSNHLLSEGVIASGAPAVTLDRFQSLLSIFSFPDAPIRLARLIGLAKIWIWAVPGMLILSVIGAVRWPQNTLCRLLAASTLLTLAGYYLVPVDQGHGWGYRYFHSAWVALPLLATAALYRPVGAAAPQAGAKILLEDIDTQTFVTCCAVLSLIFGVGFRAVQMYDFLAADLNQVPHYTGTEPRVVIISDRFSFYGADLVQNDPWLRGNEIRMYSHGASADARMMAQFYPNLHQVYDDPYGSVWSTAPIPPRAPKVPHPRG
jgi:hypothetical protein